MFFFLQVEESSLAKVAHQNRMSEGKHKTVFTMKKNRKSTIKHQNSFKKMFLNLDASRDQVLRVMDSLN